MKPLTMPYTTHELIDWLNDHSQEMKSEINERLARINIDTESDGFTIDSLIPEIMVQNLAVTASTLHTLATLMVTLADSLDSDNPESNRQQRQLITHAKQVVEPMYETVTDLLTRKATDMTEQKEAQA